MMLDMLSHNVLHCCAYLYICIHTYAYIYIYIHILRLIYIYIYIAPTLRGWTWQGPGACYSAQLTYCSGKRKGDRERERREREERERRERERGERERESFDCDFLCDLLMCQRKEWILILSEHYLSFMTADECYFSIGSSPTIDFLAVASDQ